MHRTKESEEFEKLDEVIAEITRVIDRQREDIAKDPLSVSSARLMDVIKERVPEIQDVLSPTPITVQMSGLRVKLPFDTFATRIKGVEIEDGVTVGDIADLLPSRMRDYILIRIRRFPIRTSWSETVWYFFFWKISFC